MYKDLFFCRWCGDLYKPLEKTERDGFCCSKHKQAHHRAYKKYVTGLAHIPAAARSCRVTQKKVKKRKT